MGDWNIHRVPAEAVHSVPWKDSGSSGPDLANEKPLVMSDGTLPTSVSDVPLGFVVDERPDDNPPDQANVYGEGCIVEDVGASFTVDGQIWSDGDGTISQTKPGSTAGDVIVQVGVALTSTKFLVDIQAYERGA